MKEPRVIIYGITFNHSEKAPYVTSGKSLRGALELNPAEDALKCHECGRYATFLGRHLADHQITAAEYRRKHGLRGAARLIAPSIAKRDTGTSVTRFRSGHHVRPARRRISGAQHYERVNLNQNCDAQLAARIQGIAADMGCAPTFSQLKAHKIHVSQLRRAFHTGKIDDIMRALGIEPNGHPSFRHRGRIDDNLLIEMLRDAFVRVGRPLRTRDCKPPLLLSHMTFIRHFGTWQNALAAAGLALETASERPRAIDACRISA